jgi:outer membrane protein assembly factor BamE (lipoprotein component of BamABCDE complex)
MKYIRYFYLLSFLFLLACFPLTSNSLNKIRVGDSREHVINVLGKQYTKKAYYSKTYLVYYIHDSFFEIFFNSKEFPFIGFYPLIRTGKEYWVIIDNDKVVSFGNANNYKNNIPKALDSKVIFEVE